MNRKNFFAFLLLAATAGHAAWGQYAVSPSKGKNAGDRIESTSYNDSKRGTPRTLQYLPDGDDFVCVNGKNRYTRALYGSPTAWRLETSDRPVFAAYVKGDSRHIRFRLRLADGTAVPLEETSRCEARYTPGRRSYVLTDEAWGTEACLRLAVVASPEEEAALWQVSIEGFPAGCSLDVLSAAIRQPDLSRNGDMGADPPGCFEPSEDADAVRQTLSCPLSADAPAYIRITKNVLSVDGGGEAFAAYEAARAALAGSVRITTPDPYFNPLGGALAVAADGIWGTEGVWLHGAVGWRMPLNGWRAAYVGDVLGWHDRARTHFDHYAASQVTGVPCTIPHPAQDPDLALARPLKRWGTPAYSNGYICRYPERNDQMNHYDMNLCYIDELLWHLRWTGDWDYARRMWQVLALHLAWEKRNFDPDDDGLYDACACIWASDALYYNSGAVTHSTAYNYRANRLAAFIAGKIGEDPAPYRAEADKILKALNDSLWLGDKGHWAEFRDFMGHRRLHESAAVWTVYHALDSGVADPFQAYLATRYIDKEIPHIPVTVSDVSSEERISSSLDFKAASAAINAGGYATIATTGWLPYAWSINNVAFAEVMHTALAYFQAGRPEEGFKLLKSSVLDGMYLGDSPGNFGQISFYDAARGECYRDFGDPIGVASRVLVQGLYGVYPDALNGRLALRPGFPADWEYASLHTADLDFDFRRNAPGEESFAVTHHFPAVDTLALHLPALRSQVASVKANGRDVAWTAEENAVGCPRLVVSLPCAADEPVNIDIAWEGDALAVPGKEEAYPASRLRQEGPVAFVRMEQGQMKWWAPLEQPEPDTASSLSPAKASAVLGDVDRERCVPVAMDTVFNAMVTDIFRNAYLSPRSPYTTLQLPVQGIGEWCHPLQTADIDDSGLRAAVRNGILETKPGIPFRTPAEGRNIAFTSLWDNYPDSLAVPLAGKASAAYLLLAGSTNHMQCRIDNGIIRVWYADGTCDTLPLVNPDNWPPIEQFFFEDGLAFDRKAPPLWRLRLKTGEASDHFGEEMGFPGVTREVDGGAAVLLRMPLDGTKTLSRLVLETLSNEVVIGIMGITLCP